LTDAAGFPLSAQAFEGNKAKTATMVPVINAFKAAHQLSDVTVVADAGMISETNQTAIHRGRVVVHPRCTPPVPAQRSPRVTTSTPASRSPRI
jgi:transposase